MTKIDRRVKHYIIVDIELSDSNYVKEFSYIVYNNKGIVKQCNVSVEEEFIDKATLENIVTYLLDDMRDYNAPIYAYNSSFTYRAINNTLSALDSDLSIEQPYDLMGLVSNTIALKKDYIKTCKANQWYTAKGYVSRTAETVYRYISKNHTHIQDHSSINNCITEMYILEYIKKAYKKQKQIYTPVHFRIYASYCNAISL